MNEKIKFDYSILHEKAGTLRTSASKLDAKFTEIKTSADTVRNNFSGEAADAYFQSFNSFSARFSEFKDLVDRTNLPISLVQLYIKYKDGPIYLDDDNDTNDYNMIDKVSYSTCNNLEDLIIDRIANEELLDIVNDSDMTDKEKYVFLSYFGINCNSKTLMEIKDDLMCSHQNVSQLKLKSLK